MKFKEPQKTYSWAEMSVLHVRGPQFNPQNQKNLGKPKQACIETNKNQVLPISKLPLHPQLSQRKYQSKDRQWDMQEKQVPNDSPLKVTTTEKGQVFNERYLQRMLNVNQINIDVHIIPDTNQLKWQTQIKALKKKERNF